MVCFCPVTPFLCATFQHLLDSQTPVTCKERRLLQKQKVMTNNASGWRQVQAESHQTVAELTSAASAASGIMPHKLKVISLIMNLHIYRLQLPFPSVGSSSRPHAANADRNLGGIWRSRFGTGLNPADLTTRWRNAPQIRSRTVPTTQFNHATQPNPPVLHRAHFSLSSLLLSLISSFSSLLLCLFSLLLFVSSLLLSLIFSSTSLLFLSCSLFLLFVFSYLIFSSSHFLLFSSWLILARPTHSHSLSFTH
jgi:hypothetical protein